MPAEEGLDSLPPPECVPAAFAHEARLILQFAEELLADSPGCEAMVGLMRSAVAGQSVSFDPLLWQPAYVAGEEVDPLGGCLQRFWRRWRRLAPQRPDFWRDTVLFGWRDNKLEEDFDYTIPPRIPPASKRAAFEQVYRELESMEVIGSTTAVRPTTYMFPVPKADGGQRYVSDLTHHNLNEDVPHFQGTTEARYLEWLRPRSFRISLDLTKQFWQIPARPSQQRLMVMPTPDGADLRQWCVLTMGAKGAARVGASMTSIVVSLLRHRTLGNGISYMDEAALEHQNRLLALLYQLMALILLQFLGARVNVKKSGAIPRPHLLFIGLRSHSLDNQVAPSRARLEKIRHTAASVAEKPATQ